MAFVVCTSRPLFRDSNLGGYDGLVMYLVLGVQKCIENFGENLLEKDHLERREGYGRITFIWIFYK
jgi:hypothetical protein